jgi:hypothetical protein
MEGLGGLREQCKLLKLARVRREEFAVRLRCELDSDGNGIILISSTH